MRNEVAEMKALLTRVLQQGSAQSLPSVRPLQEQQPPERLITNETRSPSKRSASNRSRRKKHRRQPSFPSDDEVDHANYQGLPLADDSEGELNELPSVRVLVSRASSSKQNREDQEHT